jgi:hypothetical protein
MRVLKEQAIKIRVCAISPDLGLSSHIRLRHQTLLSFPLAERWLPLVWVDPSALIAYYCADNGSPGLAGEHQVQNASLAVELARHYVQATGVVPSGDLESLIMTGLLEAKWPGRCQTIQDPSHSDTRWFLDGAHTVESLECCIKWYMSPGSALPALSDRPL